MKSSTGCAGTTGSECTRRWPRSARCSSSKTGFQINRGKPIRDSTTGYGFQGQGQSSGFTSGVTDFNSYIAGNPTHLRDDFQGWIGPAGGPYTGVLDFALGGSYNVQRFAMWNTANGSTANVQSYTLFVSDVADFRSSTDVGTFTNADLSSSSPYPVQVFDSLDTTGQYLCLRINSHYNNGNVVKIGKVALDIGPGNQVPKPGGLALASLALLSLAASRRTKN